MELTTPEFFLAPLLLAGVVLASPASLKASLGTFILANVLLNLAFAIIDLVDVRQ